MTHTTSISSNKGGVGKSNVTVGLAAALARTGRAVLVVDLDPQANATRRLGIDYDSANPIPTMSEVVKSGEDGVGNGAVVACGWTDQDGNPTAEAENIDVLPSRYDLTNRELEAGQVGAIRRVRKALSGWTSDYDVVLIDTPPNLNHLTQMALAAADTVLIPTEPAYDSVEGAIRVRDFVKLHAEDLSNPALKVGGVLITKYLRTAEADEQIKGIKEHFADVLWNPGKVARTAEGDEILIPSWIPEWTRMREADASAVSLTAWNDRTSRKTIALYDSIADIYVRTLLERAGS